MKTIRLVATAIACAIALCPVPVAATVITQDFTGNPLENGWHRFGNTSLFQWDSTNQDLQVTWDSSQSNSYFYHPLGTIITRDDDFSIALDLRLQDITSGSEAGKTGPMEIAFGFLNLGEATGTNFLRGVYQAAPNLAELDYFPAGTYPPPTGPVDPTLSPTLISSNAEYASGFNFPYELPVNQTLHLAISYYASNQTLVTLVTTNGVSLGPVQDVTLPAGFDFRLDTVSINSYSSAGDIYDSVLAHGTIDNIVVTVPPPPVENLAGTFSNGVWQVQFLSRTNWFYALEKTTNFQSWSNAAVPVAGNGALVTLQDTNPPSGSAFYRVQASRP